MEHSTQSNAILQLGKQLTRELDLDQTTDTLGRWMAHYIAELIHAVENATNDDDRALKLKACSDAILSVWKHRHELPSGKRPFERLEPILKALERLDPANDKARYFDMPRVSGDATQNDNAADVLLTLVDTLDYSARLLIRHFLTQVAREAIDQKAAWIELAKDAGLDDGIEFSVIRSVVDEKDLLDKANVEDMARQVLLNRIDRLEIFAKLATELATEFRQNLAVVKDGEMNL
jgi:hypothetical protein